MPPLDSSMGRHWLGSIPLKLPGLNRLEANKKGRQGLAGYKHRRPRCSGLLRHTASAARPRQQTGGPCICSPVGPTAQAGLRGLLTHFTAEIKNTPLLQLRYHAVQRAEVSRHLVMQPENTRRRASSASSDTPEWNLPALQLTGVDTG